MYYNSSNFSYLNLAFMYYNSSNFSYLLGSFLFVFTFMNSFSAFHFFEKIEMITVIITCSFGAGKTHKKCAFVTAVIIGGMDMMTQALMLGKKPHIIIGKQNFVSSLVNKTSCHHW